MKNLTLYELPILAAEIIPNLSNKAFDQSFNSSTLTVVLQDGIETMFTADNDKIVEQNQTSQILLPSSMRGLHEKVLKSGDNDHLHQICVSKSKKTYV